MSERRGGKKRPLQTDGDDDGEDNMGSGTEGGEVKVDSVSEMEFELGYNSSTDEAEDGENAPVAIERQREAAMARMQRYFGLDGDELPPEPLVQDNSNYLRKMYWSCVPDSGFPNRVNHAVAAHQ